MPRSWFLIFFFLFSKTDVNGLMDGGAYASEAGFWSDTPLCARASKQDMAAVFARGGKGTLTFMGESVSSSSGLISNQGNQQRVTPLTAPLIRTITSWGLGQVHRRVCSVSRVQEKQALGGQGMYREQKNSHLQWPEEMLHSYIPCTTLWSTHLLRYPQGQIPQIRYRQQRPKSIKSKAPSMLRTIICQDTGKFWSQNFRVY